MSYTKQARALLLALLMVTSVLAVGVGP
ncbi:surface glycoprotein, partial [Haloquadratum walsbyi]